MRKLIALFVLCATVLPSTRLSAQPLPAQFLAKVEMASNVADLLEMVTPYVIEMNSQLSVKGAMQTLLADAAAQLRWNGDPGALIEVRVEIEINTGVTRVLGSPRLVGSGSDPYKVLARSMMTPGYEQGISPGFKFSDDNSYFVWVRLKNPGDPMSRETLFGIIRPVHAGLIRDHANTVVADRDLMDAIIGERNARVLRDILAQARTTLNEDSARAQLLELQTSIEAQRAKVIDIDRRLKVELDRSAKAQEFQLLVQTLQGVLSVASLVQQAKVLFSDMDSKGLDAAASSDSSGKLILELSEYKKVKDGVITTLRVERKIDLNQLTLLKTEALGILKNQGAPSQTQLDFENSLVIPLH